jgi:hypothetical protein
MALKIYDAHILAMQEYPGFYQQWVSRLAYYPTNEAAYEATEEFYSLYFGRRKYKNYESFKVIMSKNNKR